MQYNLIASVENYYKNTENRQILGVNIILSKGNSLCSWQSVPVHKAWLY